VAEPVDPDRLTAEETALLDKLADKIVKRGMVAPAILFLESMRPMNFLASQAMAFFGPFAGMLFEPKDYEVLRELLERRASIEHIVTTLERKDQESRRKPAKS
jgi:hypothetical protein